MTITSKLLLINKFLLPKELHDTIKDYAFHSIKKIQKSDKRYEMLLAIPEKEYDLRYDLTFVYMSINQEKDYYLTYKDFKLQLQTLSYASDDNVIYSVEGHTFIIE